jgi:hypothetical protein
MLASAGEPACCLTRAAASGKALTGVAWQIGFDWPGLPDLLGLALLGLPNVIGLAWRI